jgi:hypothetical protein
LQEAIRGTITKRGELESALANLEPGYEAQADSLRKEIAANKDLERTLGNKLTAMRATAKFQAEANEANRKAAELAEKQAKLDVIAAENAAKLLQASIDKAEALKKEQEAQDALSKSRADDYGDWIVQHAQAMDAIDQREADHVANTKQSALDVAQAWGDAYTMVLDATKPVFDELGSSLVDGTFQWKDLGSAAVNSIGRIVSALGDQLAAESAVDLVKGFAALASIVNAPLAPGYFSSAAIKAGGAAAAWATGGALSSVKLAEGGVVMPTDGGTLAQIAEAGQPEAVIPLDRMGDFGGTTHLVVNLDSRPLLDKIFEATRNQTVLISAGAIV